MSFDGAHSLRTWQVAALSAWESASYRGIAEVVTGAGKTRFAVEAARQWLAKVPDGKIAVVVPTTALQDQWVIALHNDLGIPIDRISTWPGKTDSSGLAHVFVVNTARTVASQVLKGQKSLLIADECHRYATPKNISALDVDPNAALGLSATVEREYDDGLYDLLIPAIGPVFFRYDLAQARHDGVVSPFALVNVEVDLLEEEWETYQALTRQLARAVDDSDEEAIKRISLKRSSVSKAAWMRIPTTVALMGGKLRGLRTIIFHEDILSAEMICRLLVERGHSAATYHSGMDDALRRDNLRAFSEGLIDVLVTCRAVDEGVDVPDAECAVITAGTNSKRQRVQRLGRVLRATKSKEIATIFTIFATSSERERLVEEQSQLADVSNIRWMKTSSETHA